MSIYDEIKAERDYQKKRWGNDTDDTVNTPNDFMAYISHYGTRWFAGGFAPYPKSVVDNYRKHMIKVAALAIGAIESLDRQREKHGNAFYETINK